MRFNIKPERKKQLTDGLRKILQDKKITQPVEVYNAVAKIAFSQDEQEFLGSILVQMGLFDPRAGAS